MKLVRMAVVLMNVYYFNEMLVQPKREWEGVNVQIKLVRIE